MQLARVIGRATATVKHPTLHGWKLSLVQPLGADGDPDGQPLLAVDHLGSRREDRVLLTSDGAAIRDLIGDNTTPVRWAIMGICD